MMRDRRLFALRIGPEKNSCPEYSLKSRDQTAVLGTALLHSEDVQHFGGAPKGNRLFLLAHGKRSEEDRNKAVLSPMELRS